MSIKSMSDINQLLEDAANEYTACLKEKNAAEEKLKEIEDRVDTILGRMRQQITEPELGSTFGTANRL